MPVSHWAKARQSLGWTEMNSAMLRNWSWSSSFRTRRKRHRAGLPLSSNQSALGACSSTLDYGSTSPKFVNRRAGQDAASSVTALLWGEIQSARDTGVDRGRLRYGEIP